MWIFKYFIPFAYLVLLSHFWGISGWVMSRGPLATDCMGLFFVFYAFFHKTHEKYNTISKQITHLIYYLGIAPFFAVFLKMFFCSDSFYIEIQQSLVMAMTFFSYFYLKKNKFTEKECLTILFVFGIISFLVQFYQLTHLDNRLFGFNTEGGSGARNGIARLTIGCSLISMFLIYFCWTKILERKKTILNIIGFVVFLISVYLSLTRQYLVAVLATLLFSILIQKNKKMKIYAYICGTFLFYILYLYSDAIFGDLFYITKNETESTDIRLRAYPFFITHIFSDPLRLFFGHAHPSDMMKVGLTRGLWAIDLGVIGEMYHYGILWGAAYFWVLYKIWKYKKCLPFYIKMYAFSTFVHSPMVGAYVSGITAFMWVIFLYLTQLHICKYKETKCETTKNEKI